MKTYLVIVNSETNNIFSKVRQHTPKTFNQLKAYLAELTEMFDCEFKVKRCIPTKAGLKFI